MGSTDALFPNHKGTQKMEKGDPKGTQFWAKRGPKGDLFDVKGDPKFEFFRIVHKERIWVKKLNLKIFRDGWFLHAQPQADIQLTGLHF